MVDNLLDKYRREISVIFVHPINGSTIEAVINPTLLDRLTVDDIIGELVNAGFIDGTNRFIKYVLIIDDEEKYIEGNHVLGRNSMKHKSVVQIIEGCKGCG